MHPKRRIPRGRKQRKVRRQIAGKTRFERRCKNSNGIWSLRGGRRGPVANIERVLKTRVRSHRNDVGPARKKGREG
eukprot:2851171-Pleurochrysis_carterae.AAC.1